MRGHKLVIRSRLSPVQWCDQALSSSLMRETDHTTGRSQQIRGSRVRGRRSKRSHDPASDQRETSAAIKWPAALIGRVQKPSGRPTDKLHPCTMIGQPWVRPLLLIIMLLLLLRSPLSIAIMRQLSVTLNSASGQGMLVCLVLRGSIPILFHPYPCDKLYCKTSVHNRGVELYYITFDDDLSALLQINIMPSRGQEFIEE